MSVVEEPVADDLRRLRREAILASRRRFNLLRSIFLVPEFPSDEKLPSKDERSPEMDQEIGEISLWRARWGEAGVHMPHDTCLRLSSKPLEAPSTLFVVRFSERVRSDPRSRRIGVSPRDVLIDVPENLQRILDSGLINRMSQYFEDLRSDRKDAYSSASTSPHLWQN